MEFVGRHAELRRLSGYLAPVLDSSAAGRSLLVTGRRRVGKSRLVQEFCDRSGVASVVFQASRGRSAASERADFLTAVTRSGLPGADTVAGLSATDWLAALRAVAIAVAPPGEPASPVIVVLDEVPWLMEQDPEFEGSLQTAWDRTLSSLPLLLVLVGSDAGVMEALQSQRRAFHRRATPFTVEPLNVADVRRMTGLAAVDAVDASLVTGGFPELVAQWQPGRSWRDHVADALTSPLSPLLVAGQLMLIGEFPEISLSQRVLRAVGHGERAFSAIATWAGDDGPLASGTLSPLLRGLVAKRVVAADLPLSTRSDTRNTRYRVSDSYLRFWLAFLADSVPAVERGRGDAVLRRIEAGWPSWRGRAVEPLVRDSVGLLAASAGWPEIGAVGSWWNRQNSVEVDIVGSDRARVARQVHFVGSITWREQAAFDGADRHSLASTATVVPGVDASTPLVAVSRSGFSGDGLDVAAAWDAEDVVSAWDSLA